MHVVAVHARDELTPPIDSSMKTIGLFAASILRAAKKRSFEVLAEFALDM
jgi:hypothetical protein